MISTRLLAVSALLCAAPFLLAELGGLRIHASILTGQLPASAADGVAGLAYVLAWFAAVLVAPVLAIAAALLFATSRGTIRSASAASIIAPE
jgi:hypothetical protein